MNQDIVSVIERFRKHPAGCPEEFDLRQISMFINGYETALLVHDINEVGATFNGGFTKYLKLSLKHI